MDQEYASIFEHISFKMAESLFSNIQLGEKSIMSMPSKFPDHECKKCGIMIKEGDTIVKVDAGHFCKNEQCPEPCKTVVTEAPKPAETNGQLPKYIREQVTMLTEIESIVKAELTGAVDAKIGMYVKEIYRQVKLRENLP